MTEGLHFHFSLSCIGEENGNPLQCSCLENPRDGGGLVGCPLWGRTESDTTEATQQQQQHPHPYNTGKLRTFKSQATIHDSWKNHSFDYPNLYWQSDVSAFNMLSRFVITFLPRSKCLLISWLQSPSAVILEPKKMKSFSVSIVSPCICHEVIRPDAMIFIF